MITELKVRYSETDQMGIVHHSHYINWFEVGRTNFIYNALKMSYGEIEKHGVLLPVISVQSFYRTSANFDDDLQIITSIFKYNGVRMIFKYEVIKKSDQTLIADGYTEHCWTNEKMRPVNLRRIWPELHEKINMAMEAE